MINLFNIFKEQFSEALNKVAESVQIEIDDFLLQNFTVEPTKDKAHGDLACNVAMVGIKKFSGSELKNPRQLAQAIIDHFDKKYVADISIAGPGFINIKLKNNILCLVINELVTAQKINLPNFGKGRKVNLEYASPNPTGPIHVGHTRGAIYGDVLANLLQKVGYDVLREYYINDAGAQIDVLLESSYLRYCEACGQEVEIGEGLYPGEYLIVVGQKIKEKFGNDLQNIEKDQALIQIRDFVVELMVELIKEDLLALGIKHDSYFSEKKNLHDQGKIPEVIDFLRKKELIYKGVVELPQSNKGKKVADNEEQTLFKSSEFGDDQDRVVLKSDESPTYFAGDMAYTKTKIERGAELIIMPLGYDHAGYVKRLTAVNNVLSDNQVTMKIILCQLVKFVKDGQPLKMSKRAGNFITARQVIDEIGADVLRFIMLTRKNDALFDFDLAKAVEQSKDNPIFYVQYAHARCCSVLRNIKRDHPELMAKIDESIKLADSKNADEFLTLLKDESEIELMLKIANFPRIIEMAVKSFEPHRIAFYLQDLAAAFHALWHKGSENSDLKFIISDNFALTCARIYLVLALKNIIALALEIFSIKALEEMN